MSISLDSILLTKELVPQPAILVIRLSRELTLGVAQLILKHLSSTNLNIFIVTKFVFANEN